MLDNAAPHITYSYVNILLVHKPQPSSMAKPFRRGIPALWSSNQALTYLHINVQYEHQALISDYLLNPLRFLFWRDKAKKPLFSKL